MIKKITSENAPKAIGPYSQAIAHDNTLYVSGQLPINPKTGEMPDSVEEQAKQSLTNISEILKAAGTNIDNVIKCVVYMADMDDFQKVNEVYASFFKEPYPARVAIEVSKLPKNAKVEIDAVALL